MAAGPWPWCSPAGPGTWGWPRAAKLQTAPPASALGWTRMWRSLAEVRASPPPGPALGEELLGAPLGKDAREPGLALEVKNRVFIQCLHS